MKQILVTLFLICLLASGAAAQADKAPKAAPKGAQKAAQKAKPAAPAVPADAEKVAEGLWRARDAQGRTWMYRRTPFGIVRYEDEGAAEAAASPRAPVRVRESGADRVVFERQTPFGVRSWTKKPSELDEEERQALEAWEKSAKK